MNYQLEKRLLVIFATLWAGFQALSALGDTVQHWANLTSYIVQVLNLDTTQFPFLYPVIFCAPLPIVLLMLGFLVLQLNRLPAVRSLQQPQPSLEPRPVRRFDSQIWKHLSSFSVSLVRGVASAFGKRPWWFVTFFATLLALSIFSLDLPTLVAFLIGVCALILAAVSLTTLILSAVDFKDYVQLESRALFALFGVICFTGFIAFQTDNINQMLQSVSAIRLEVSPSEKPSSSQASPSGPVSGEPRQGLTELMKDFLTMESSEDATRSLFIIFAVLFGLAGMIAARESPLVGLILGVILGGIVGLLMGSVVGVAISFGSGLRNIFP